jgi:hypothetical protein
MTLALISNGDLGGLARTKINAGLTQRNNIKALNIRDFGATGDGVTDDSAAIASAITASNALQFSDVTPVIYAPGGVYKLGTTTLPIFKGGGAVVGDGQNKTYFQLTPSYSGDVFSWSEAWYFNAYNNIDHVSGNSRDIPAGPAVRDFSIFGDRTNNANQIALGLYDRCDNVQFSDVQVGWCTRGLYIGAPKIQVQSYNRESHYRNLKFWYCGTTTIPAVELTTTGAGDTTNQLVFNDLNIFGSRGVSLWLRGNPGAAVRLCRFYGLRVENMIGSDGADMIMIGDPTMTGFIRDIYFWGLEAIVGPASFANLRLTANSGPNMPFLIGVHGGIVNGGAVGIAVDYGRSLAFELDALSGTTAGITIGANTSGPIYLNGYGSEEFWVKTVANANVQAGIRMPTNNAIETATTAVDPISLADGAGQTINVNAAGCRYKDFAMVSFDQDLLGITLTAWCATDVVKCRFQNETGGVIDLASGTLRVKVIKSAT